MLRPGSVRDISRMLRFAGRHGIRVVGRGAGHTVFGQSQHLAAIAFDLTTLDEIGPIVDGVHHGRRRLQVERRAAGDAGRRA